MRVFSWFPRPLNLAIVPLFLLSLARPVLAAGDAVFLDDQAIAQLELRAQQSKPREQCFLYTELVHALTEIAGRQMVDGDSERASASLKRVEQYAQLIHLGLANDTKRVKNAELLMHNTTYRLTGLMHLASGGDRVTLQATLDRLNQIHDELLTQVFTH